MKVILLLTVSMALLASVSAGDYLARFLRKYQKYAEMKATEICIGKDAYKKYVKQVAKAAANCGNDENQVGGLGGNPGQLISALLDGIQNGQDDFEDRDGSTAIHIHGDFYNRGSVGQNVQAADALVNSLLSQMGMKQDGFHGHKEGDKFYFHNHPNAKPGHHHNHDDAEAEAEAEPEHHHERRGRQLNEDKVEKDSDLEFLAEGLRNKIMNGKHHLESKIGNFTCLMKEMKFADDNLDLDHDGIMNSIEEYKEHFDPYFYKQAVKNGKLCYEEAQALPESVLNACSFGPKFARLSHLAICQELRFKKDCMLLDAKQKLEEYFGSFDKIVQESEMKEEQLLMLVQKLMYGKQHY